MSLYSRKLACLRKKRTAPVVVGCVSIVGLSRGAQLVAQAVPLGMPRRSGLSWACLGDNIKSPRPPQHLLVNMVGGFCCIFTATIARQDVSTCFRLTSSPPWQPRSWAACPIRRFSPGYGSLDVRLRCALGRLAPTLSLLLRVCSRPADIPSAAPSTSYGSSPPQNTAQ